MYFLDLKTENYEECDDGDGTGVDEKEIISSDYPTGFTKQECIDTVRGMYTGLGPYPYANGATIERGCNNDL